MTQDFSVTVNELVAALQQRRIMAVLLDHVAQLAKVMNQQALTAFVLIVLPQRAQEVAHHVFEFGLFNFECDGKCTLKHQRFGRLTEAAVQQGT